ncbi:Pc15g00130 [Penicillium rubens Wisconsin 54-1255]|uniref:Pc15g00130 protein n=2 Tax=Penicillium chrysogenum species complex TaxID=254878 RepID=B6H6G0_PENRW|nr:Pc15g00130 [Penicillium rubens Wisconsin 54-1255]
MTLNSLPNEIFIQILSDFPTRALLPLMSVNHRFRALVLRILHYRLLLSMPLKEYKLLLECFHPSSKLTEPHVFCKYLGTDGLNERHDETGLLYENIDAAHHLGRVAGLYSRFRPEVSSDEEDERGTIRSKFAFSPGRMLLLSEVVGFIRADINGGREGQGEDAVIREVTLDGYEDFSQLCVVANLVQVKPGTSLLLSASTIEDGFVRLWREWLRDQSGRKEKTAEIDWEEDSERMFSDDDILWVDMSKTVGLKMHVRPKAWDPSLPVLIHQDDRNDDAWVGYEVILEGESLLLWRSSRVDLIELHIRSTRLLMAVEQSKEEQKIHQTNAMVIGAPIPVS